MGILMALIPFFVEGGSRGKGGRDRSRYGYICRLSLWTFLDHSLRAPLVTLIRTTLVVVDYFTRWTEAYAIPNQEATTVAKKLLDEMFFRFSPPEQLHSDRGRQFESNLITELCKLLNI